MVSTRNTSRSNANPARMPDPPGDADSRPPGPAEAIQANTNEVEALRLVNQRLIEEIEQLTRQIHHPREERQVQEGRHGYGVAQNIEAEAESSQARGHSPQLAPVREESQAARRGCGENVEPRHSPTKRADVGAKIQGPPTRAQSRKGSN